MIFRVRSAKAVKITDMDLIKRLGAIVGMFILFLIVRTLVSPPKGITISTCQPRRGRRREKPLQIILLAQPTQAKTAPQYKASFSLLLDLLDVVNLIIDPILVILVIIGETADNLKAFLCESNWWDHSFTISKYC